MTPYIVAEMSASHCQSLPRALEIVERAKWAGADAVKLQTWTELVVTDREVESGPWKGQRYRDLYREAKLPWEWHEPIVRHAQKIGIDWFSTPFDEESVDFLESLGCPRYKIASSEITHLDLIGYTASKGKPIVISTGMANFMEVGSAVTMAETAGARGRITLMKCNASYPAPIGEMNLATIPDLREAFDCEVGLSDHSKGWTAAVVATALGATMIEKHLNLDQRGADAGFAILPHEFQWMVKSVGEAAASVGQIQYGPTGAEQDSLQYRRSAWVTRDIAEGEEYTRDNLGIYRPASGGKLKDFHLYLGNVASKPFKAGDPFLP